MRHACFEALVLIPLAAGGLQELDVVQAKFLSAEAHLRETAARANSAQHDDLALLLRDMEALDPQAGETRLSVSD